MAQALPSHRESRPSNSSRRLFLTAEVRRQLNNFESSETCNNLTWKLSQFNYILYRKELLSIYWASIRFFITLPAIHDHEWTYLTQHENTICYLEYKRCHFMYNLVKLCGFIIELSSVCGGIRWTQYEVQITAITVTQIMRSLLPSSSIEIIMVDFMKNIILKWTHYQNKHTHTRTQRYSTANLTTCLCRFMSTLNKN